MAASAGRWGAENGQERYLRAFMPDGCERDLLLAALRGTRPPGYLLAHLLQRIRADRHVDLPRAALLRLILVRSTDPPQKETLHDRPRPGPSQPALPVRPHVRRPGRRPARRARTGSQHHDRRQVPPGRDRDPAGDPHHAAEERKRTPQAHPPLQHRRLLRPQHPPRRGTRTHQPGRDGIPATLALAGQAEFILGYHHQRAADLAGARARREQNNNITTSTTTDPGDAE